MVSETYNLELSKNFLEEEMVTLVNGNKSLEQDGYTFAFLKSFWVVEVRSESKV